MPTLRRKEARRNEMTLPQRKYRHLWFWRDLDGDETWWPDWLSWSWSAALRLRCLGVFHRFEKANYGDEMPLAHAWYCVRCLGPYEHDEEFVLGDTWHRLMWRISRGLYRWWDSWAWRFDR